MQYLYLPGVFLRFWFIDALLGLTHFFASVNQAFFQLVSLPLLVKTFFRPLKNEYREGLVGFSIGMGIIVKTCIIAVDLAVFLVLLLIEVLLILFFLSLPFVSVMILFL